MNSNRINIMLNPDKVEVPEEYRAEKDRYETIICILSHGIRFISVEADAAKLVFVFDCREIAEVEKKLMIGEDFPVIWQKVIPALNIWKDAYIALKDKRRSAKQ